MGYHWEASQRPLIIKTVWVEGHRHAILSDGERSKKLGGRKTTHHRAEQPPSEYRERPAWCLTTDAHKMTIERHAVERCKSKKSSTLRICLKTTLHHSATDENVLSERVLQWLDLAGLVDDAQKAPKTLKMVVPKSEAIVHDRYDDDRNWCGGHYCENCGGTIDNIDRILCCDCSTSDDSEHSSSVDEEDPTSQSQDNESNSLRQAPANATRYNNSNGVKKKIHIFIPSSFRCD